MEFPFQMEVFQSLEQLADDDSNVFFPEYPRLHLHNGFNVKEMSGTRQTQITDQVRTGASGAVPRPPVSIQSQCTTTDNLLHDDPEIGPFEK